MEISAPRLRFHNCAAMTETLECQVATDSIDAILPAGGRIEGELARESATDIKALLMLDGATLLERAITALRGSPRINRIVVIGPPHMSTHAAARDADIVLSEGDSGPENIFRGLNWLQENQSNPNQASSPQAASSHNNSEEIESRDEKIAQSNRDESRDGIETSVASGKRVLIATTDLPFLTPQAINDFLDKCSPQARICVPIYTKDEFEARFPNEGGEYIRLSDGEWTAGCVYLLDGEALLRNRAHIEDIFNARKSQIAMARLLGPAFIARFLTRRLAIPHILQRCEHVLKCRGQAVRGCAPELAFDIDSIEDLRAARLSRPT